VATYRDLEVWRFGLEVVEQSYRVTSSFPVSERYGIASQMRRAALSIPVNIAEGHCRGTTRAFLNHVSIALGSQGELETCIEIAARLGLLSAADRQGLDLACCELGRMLNGLRRGLHGRLKAQRPDPDA
jgi:four helix bundle protein